MCFYFFKCVLVTLVKVKYYNNRTYKSYKS